MSTCISRHGEYGEHVITEEGPARDRFVCGRCFVFDEEAALDEIDRMAALLAAHTPSSEIRFAGQGRVLAEAARVADLHRGLLDRLAGAVAPPTETATEGLRPGCGSAANYPAPDPAPLSTPPSSSDAPSETATDDEDFGPGCECTSLCSMGPTCPGGMLASLPGSGCYRADPATPPSSDADIADLIERSSFGTDEATALRATVSDEQVARIVARSKELASDADRGTGLSEEERRALDFGQCDPCSQGTLDVEPCHCAEMLYAAVERILAARSPQPEGTAEAQVEWGYRTASGMAMRGSEEIARAVANGERGHTVGFGNVPITEGLRRTITTIVGPWEPVEGGES